ncbi:MAG: SH3 domain-containing protein, partial [Butyrivibrio sp.]|nr:SH3 domain-containing protein [Butyrivibrio sp.]
MKNLRKRVLSLGLSVIVSAAVFVSAGLSAYAYTETTGTVKTSNVKVRSSASTTASQVSSLREGDTIDIVDEATDASGYVWYKIRVNKSEYGYVRSDLVSKAGGSSSSSSSTTANTSQSNAAAAEQLPATTATAVEAKSATITEESVNVREGAG